MYTKGYDKKAAPIKPSYQYSVGVGTSPPFYTTTRYPLAWAMVTMLTVMGYSRVWITHTPLPPNVAALSKQSSA